MAQTCSLAFLIAAHAQGAAPVSELMPLDERSVTVGGVLAERIEKTIDNNLLKIDVERDFLDPFRKKTGQYVGMGNMLEALIRLSAHTGNSRVNDLRRKTIAALIETQQSDGYIGTKPEERRFWQPFDAQDASYIVYALVLDHRLFGEKNSLAAARRLGNYIVEQLERDARNGSSLSSKWKLNESIAIDFAMVSLYGKTGDRKYLEFCRRTLKLAEWDSEIVLGALPGNPGHNYAHLCKLYGQLLLHQLHPDPQLLRPSRRVLDFFTSGNGMVITGSSGESERWHDTQNGGYSLGELCANTYTVRLLKELLQIEPKPLYGDMMERVIYNALLPAQSSDGRHICYFLPFEGKRYYFPRDTYCCPNNYRRFISEIPSLVYFSGSQGITVNLYTPSTAKIKLDTAVVEIRQETVYPYGGRVEITVSPSRPSNFALRLRVPAWCSKASVRVNSERARPVEPGFLSIERKWSSADRVILEMPMSLRLVKGRVRQAGRFAVMHGPLVLGLNRGNVQWHLKRDNIFGIPVDRSRLELPAIYADPSTLEGPFYDEVGGSPTCRLKGWTPGLLPSANPDMTLTLTEYGDQAVESIYFKAPNPRHSLLVDDELISRQ